MPAKPKTKVSTGAIPLSSFLVSKGANIPDESTWTLDQGVDIPFSGHTEILAVGPGIITHEGIGGFGPWAPVLHVTDGPLKGKTFYYGHCGPNTRHKGDRVQAGEVITQIADPTVGISTGPHIEFGQCDTSGNPIGGQSASETKQILSNLKSGSLITSTSGANPGGPPTPGASSAADVAAVSKAAAISSFINLPGLFDQAESLALKGERSLMNDQPLMPFIEQLCQASLRSFQSMPNGNFFAFVPDYFGGLDHRTPYWEIDDIEIVNGRIDLSDDALATHVYIVGDTGTIDGQVDILEKIQTAGVVTVFNAFMADFLNGMNSPIVAKGKKGSKKTEAQYQKELDKIPTLAQKDKAISFLKKYGARPYYEEAPMIRSHYFEMFLAYQRFCMLWSKQFLTTFEFTFMPELFPGGLVAFPDHGIQCYVDEVTHEGSYESGFVTRANLSAPSALDGSSSVREGMIRSGIFSPAASATNHIQSHHHQATSN